MQAATISRLHKYRYIYTYGMALGRYSLNTIFVLWLCVYAHVTLLTGSGELAYNSPGHQNW